VAITGALTVSSGSGVYSYNSSTGVYTLLKNATVTVTNSQSTGTATAIIPMLFVNGVLRTLCHSPAAINQWCEASYTGKHLAGEYFTVTNGQATSNNQRISFMATENVAVSVYSTPNITNADRIGEIVQTTNAVAPNGFISAMNKSIGQTGSGATFTGNSYYALYEHIWDLAGLTTTAGHVYRISSAKGASASADFAANKTITIDYETNAPFIRGKASAANIGAYTDSDNKDHFHIGGDRRATAFPYSSGAPYGRTSTTNGVVSTQGGTEVSSLAHTSSIGGAEAKPKNVSLFMYIRYTGDSNIIVGSFNGLQSCVDTLSCTDTFSGTVDGSGATQRENTNWINGNCSYAASTWSCPFVSGVFTVTPSCLITPITGASAVGAIVTSASSSSVSFVTTNTLGSGVQAPFNIICQKQGADYIGKTAMAVASDQNVRTPGVTNVGVHAFQISSACGLTKSSLSGATTTGTATATSNCTINFPANTWSDIYYCGGNSTWSGTQDNYVVTGSLSTSSYVFYVRYNGTTGSNAAAWIQCMGVLK
jgi:hypothetical protein